MCAAAATLLMTPPCSYQTAHQTFARIGLGAAEAERLMLRAISLAAQARTRFLDSAAGKARTAAGHKRPLSALSLGPYGATLSNGAEYTGVYPSPADTGADMSMDELVAFHVQRLRPFASNTEAWSAIDVLALETLPRADEALACRVSSARPPASPHRSTLLFLSQLALKQLENECLAKDAAWQRKELLISFVFPAGEQLPWPSAKRSLAQECEALLDATLGAVGEAGAPPGAAAIGINCTKPHFLQPLVAALTEALSRRALAAHPHLFVSAAPALRLNEALTSSSQLYPDGGQVWDGINKTWSAGPDVPAEHATPAGWAQALLTSARPATENAAWGGVWLGGCCKSGDKEIAELSRLVLEEKK
jgi:homocysteine S-methyltransferase